MDLSLLHWPLTLMWCRIELRHCCYQKDNFFLKNLIPKRHFGKNWSYIFVDLSPRYDVTQDLSNWVLFLYFVSSKNNCGVTEQGKTLESGKITCLMRWGFHLWEANLHLQQKLKQNVCKKLFLWHFIADHVLRTPLKVVDPILDPI